MVVAGFCSYYVVSNAIDEAEITDTLVMGVFAQLLMIPVESLLEFCFQKPGQPEEG